MAHVEHFAFVSDTKKRHRRYFAGKRVLDVGSRDWNGGVRELFDGCEYVGVDCCPGVGVDVVAFGHEFDDPRPFDVALTCETLEHDPHWQRTLTNMVRLLRPGGLFVATWASPLRPEHGTRRTGEEIYGPDADYYRGLSADDVVGAIGSAVILTVTPGRDGHDLYAVGFRVGRIA